MPLPCLKPRRSSKVCPAPNSSLDVDLVEVRKGRMLRIQHINPRLRNKQVPHTKYGKNQTSAAAPLELHVPRVSFYGNKCVVTDASTPNSNHVKNVGGSPSPNNIGSGRTPSNIRGGLSPNNHRVHSHISGINSNLGRCVKSNHFPSNLSKEQKRMLFKMGVRSVSALKNIVLFFFHGVGGSSDIWQTQINYFSSLGFEIVAPDLIGHGMSEVPPKKKAYHFREILADVVAIFDRYCKKKNLVIGHSYGCAFTTVLARERARRVWRLIMISGGGPIPLSPEIGIFAFPLWFVSCIRPCLDQVFEKSAFKKKQKNEMLKRASFNIPSFVLHYVINGQDWPEGDEVYHSWISVPTLLINGKDDNFATLEDAKLMKATIHGSKLEIVDEASHMVMLEAPDKVNKLILDFICSRGSHKLPDVKESAEEGQESPLRTLQACSYGGGGGSGGGGGGKPLHPLYLPQHHRCRAEELQSRTPTQHPREKNMINRPETVMVPEEYLGYMQQPEIVMRAPETYVEVTHAQDNRTPWQKQSSVQHGSSYDNASYESDESGEEYYYYKDQYGNHHYISAKEYARQFPNSDLPPSDYRTGETEMDVCTVDIPAFEDIPVDPLSSMDGTPTNVESTPDYNSASSCSVRIDSNYATDFDSDGGPGYMVSREACLSDSNFEPFKLAEVCESTDRFETTNPNPLPIFSVPELRFCEECIQNEDAKKTGKCHKCLQINMAAAEYMNHQTSGTRRQSVTLALGRQGSDSLDYLGQEQLIIIYDETEEEEISISSSADDSRSGQRHLPKDHLANHNVTRQRTNLQEAEEPLRKMASLPTVDEQEENSPHHSYLKCHQQRINPTEKYSTQNKDLIRGLHAELLAKVNKRNNLSNESKILQAENKESNTNLPLTTEPSSEEGIVYRKNSFLESKKLMEAHFSKTAFKIPLLPSSRTISPHEGPAKKIPPKILTPKPHRSNYSQVKLNPGRPVESVACSSPSFLQSKKAIHEHFSKIGAGSSINRPYSSPNIASNRTGSEIKDVSPPKELKKSNSSPCNLSEVVTESEESLSSESENSEEGSPISARLRVSEWAERHIKRITELASLPESKTSPEISKTNRILDSPVSGPSSPVSTLFSPSEWSERHSRKITGSISPVGSPSIKKNVTPKGSPKKQEIESEESETKISLSINDWVDRHLNLVATRGSFSSPVSVASENEAVTSPVKETSISAPAISLTLDDWAQRHLQRVTELSKSAENKRLNPTQIISTEDERVRKGSRRTENPTQVISTKDERLEKDSEPSENFETKTLSLTEWAERHIRKVNELNSRSPKALQARVLNSESGEQSLFRTSDGIAKLVAKPSFSFLNEWAERHVRRISEAKLTSGTPKDESKDVKDANTHKKEEMATISSSVNNFDFETSSLQLSFEDCQAGLKSADEPVTCESELPEVNEHFNDDNKEKKNIIDNSVLDSCTAGVPSSIQERRLYETSNSIDPPENHKQFTDTEKTAQENKDKVILSVNSNVNKIKEEKYSIVSGINEEVEPKVTNSTNCLSENTTSNNPPQNECHSLNRGETSLDKENNFPTANHNVTKEKKTEDNLGLNVSIAQKPLLTTERKYLLHRNPQNKPRQDEDQKRERNTKSEKDNNPTKSNSTGEDTTITGTSRCQNVCILGVSKISQETISSHRTTLSESRVLCSSVDTDPTFGLSHETVIDSTALKPQPEKFYRRKRPLALQTQSQTLQTLVQDNNNNNNNNNNDTNVNSNTCNSNPIQSDVQPRRKTVDDNSNVVTSTNVSPLCADSTDKEQTSVEERQSLCHRSTDISAQRDSQNNRLLSITTPVTTSGIENLTNLSNAIAHASTSTTTTTTTSKN